MYGKSNEENSFVGAGKSQKIMDMMKRERASSHTEQKYMATRSMHLTLQVMGQKDPARSEIFRRMVKIVEKKSFCQLEEAGTTWKR